MAVETTSNNTRRRLIKSVSTVEAALNETVIKSPPTLPDYNRSKTKICHQERTSLLSTGSKWEDYTGLINLTKVLLILANIRLFIENLMHFGLQIDVIPNLFLLLKDPWNWTNTWILVEINIFAVVSLHIERLLARDILSVSIGKWCHILNTLLLLILPITQIVLAPSMPIPAFASLIMVVVFFLKIWSYAQANRWYRSEAEEKRKEKMKLQRSPSKRTRRYSVPADVAQVESAIIYPNNLTTSNLYYFLLSPTLCYEMEYPRTNKIRIGFAVARLAESVFLLWLMVALTQQWIIPHLQNAVETGQDHPGLLLHHLISMAVPNNIIWLIFFVCIFHSWLNFLSEILRFADREFYRDWWNAQDVQYFWAAWNIPIHKWCVRHMYKPMLRSGYSKGFVSFCVFAFSAVFHEVMVSVPLQRLRFYSFLGMVAQVPLQPITAFAVTHFGPNYGNMLVWTQIIMGQSMGALAYVTDWFLFG